MRSVLKRIGGQYAFHQRVVLPLLALLSFGTAFADSERAADAVPSLWIAIAAIAGFAAWALFSLLAIAGSRIPKSRLTTRGIVAIGIYGATEAFRAVLVALLAVQFGQATVVNYPFRIVAGGLTGLVLFAMVAILLNDGWAYRAQRVRLNEVQRELQQALGFRKVDLEQRFAELVDAVRAAVHNALKAITSQTQDTPESARLAAIELTRISDEVVRPLAHELYAEVGLDGRRAQPERTRVTFAAVIEQASVADPFLPGPTVIITGTLLAGQVFFGQHNAMGSIATVIALGLMYAFLWAARRYLTPQMPRLPLGIRWLVIAVVGAIFAAGITLGAISLLSESIHINIVVMTVYIVAFGDFLLFAIALGPGLAAARDQVIADLAESNRTLRWQNARLNAQLLAEQKTVARALHRDVQGVLVAASLRLENAIRAGEPIEQASSEVRELIEMATNFAIARQPVALHSAIVESLREMWQGVLEIHLDAEPDAAERLDLDPIARQSFAEALGEFCVDSVKHGRAHSIHVTITMESNDALLLVMVNDGAPLPDGAPTGLGSQLLSSSLISFRRGNISGGVQVRATLPLAEPIAV